MIGGKFNFLANVFLVDEVWTPFSYGYRRILFVFQLVICLYCLEGVTPVHKHSLNNFWWRKQYLLKIICHACFKIHDFIYMYHSMRFWTTKVFVYCYLKVWNCHAYVICQKINPYNLWILYLDFCMETFIWWHALRSIIFCLLSTDYV